MMTLQLVALTITLPGTARHTTTGNRLIPFPGIHPSCDYFSQDPADSSASGDFYSRKRLWYVHVGIFSANDCANISQVSNYIWIWTLSFLMS